MKTRFRSATILAAVLAASFGVAVASPPAQAAGPGGLISGTVRVAGSGVPVAGADVTVLKLGSNGAPDGTIVHGPQGIANATTAADGSYHVTVPPSDSHGYWVCFFAGFTLPYSPQCYVNQNGFSPFPNPLGFFSVPPASTTISVAAWQHVRRIDAALTPFGGGEATGSIAGKVTDRITGRPLRNVTVYAYDAANHIVANGLTRTDGTYTVDSVLAGANYAVCFNGSAAKGGLTLHAYSSRCYPQVPWNGRSAPPPGSIRVPVTADASTGGIDTSLVASR